MRTKRDYNGHLNPQKKIEDVLPSILYNIEKDCMGKSELIIQQWAQIIGPKFAPLATAVSFKDGVLQVRVKTATLYSLLVQHEKARLLDQLRKKFPNQTISNINFRIG